MKLEFSQQLFEKYSNIKLHENPSSGSRVVPCGRTDGHDELIIAFRNLGNALKNNKCTPPNIQFSSSSFSWGLSITSTYPPQHPTLRRSQRSSIWMTAQSFTAQQKEKQQLLIVAFFMSRKNILNWVSASILQFNLSVTSPFIKVTFRLISITNLMHSSFIL